MLYDHHHIILIWLYIKKWHLHSIHIDQDCRAKTIKFKHSILFWSK